MFCMLAARLADQPRHPRVGCGAEGTGQGGVPRVWRLQGGHTPDCRGRAGLRLCLELSVSWIVALLGRNGLPLLRSEEGASSWSLKCHTFCCSPLQMLNIPVSHVFANTILYNADGSYAGFDPAEFPSRSGGKAEAVKHIKKVGRAPAAAAPLSRPPPYCHAALCIFFKLPAASLPPWAVSGEIAVCEDRLLQPVPTSASSSQPPPALPCSS